MNRVAADYRTVLIAAAERSAIERELTATKGMDHLTLRNRRARVHYEQRLIEHLQGRLFPDPRVSQ